MSKLLFSIRILVALLTIMGGVTLGQDLATPVAKSERISRINIALDGNIEFQSWIKRLMLLKEHRYDDLSKNVHFLQTTTAEKLGAAIAAFHGESYSVAPINSKTGVELMAPIETGTTGGAYIIYLLQKERYRADLMVECLRERKYAVAEQVVTQACMEGLIDTVAATQQDNIGEAEGILKTTADGRSFMKAQCNPDIGDYIEMIEKLTKEWGGDAFQH